MNTKEAIERIKGRFDKWALDEEDMKAIQTLIPELAESEDERAYRELVGYINKYTSDSDTRKKRWLAWLERKKEQKPRCTTYLDISSNEFEACMLRYLQSAASRKDDAMIMIDTKGYATQLREIARKEQKPAEWSEEDEKMIERLIRHTQKEFDELCNDRYGHQEIISDLKESCRERMNWLENRLKSLRPQPHWKPSEEQMNALKVVARGFPTDDPDAIDSLLTDLQKLL